MYTLNANQSQMLTFVMVDDTEVEVPGLGDTFLVSISKGGGPFLPGTGTKHEIASGWYGYLAPALELDTVGPFSVLITGAGCAQQNLMFNVEEFSITAVRYTYTMTNGVSGAPLPGVQIWISVDAAGTNVVWAGVTDTFGVALDMNGKKPLLDPGTYYFWRKRPGFIFSDPDIEVVA